MSNCIRCNTELAENLNFCPACGEDQRVKIVPQESGSASFLMVLCILTIIGSIFTIGRAYLYEMVSMMEGNSDYIRGWIYAGSAIGTLMGAILMMQRKLSGLYLYSVSQVIYIVTVIVASLSYGDAFESASVFASALAMFFLIPSVVFLILYWTGMVRKHLK